MPGAGTTFPTLTSTNYIEWSLVMKVHLESWGLWDAIEGNAQHVRDDKSALGVLLRAVPPEMLGVLVVKETAKAAWDTIKVMRMGCTVCVRPPRNDSTRNSSRPPSTTARTSTPS